LSDQGHHDGYLLTQANALIKRRLGGEYKFVTINAVASGHSEA